MAYVLLIESDNDVANIFGEFFRAEGYRCGIARSRRVAQRVLRHVRPDLVLVESLLCDGDGLELARLAAKIGVPAVVMSTDPDRTKRAEEAGFVSFQKPFKLAALRAAASALIAAGAASKIARAQTPPGAAAGVSAAD
jgi:DNA-binding response OmpR family regulator